MEKASLARWTDLVKRTMWELFFLAAFLYIVSGLFRRAPDVEVIGPGSVEVIRTRASPSQAAPVQSEQVGHATSLALVRRGAAAPPVIRHHTGPSPAPLGLLSPWPSRAMGRCSSGPIVLCPHYRRYGPQIERSARRYRDCLRVIHGHCSYPLATRGLGRGAGPATLAVKARFLQALVVWGLKEGSKKFAEGFKGACEAKGKELANTGIGWALTNILGLDLSKPDQQAITNEKLQKISDTLDQHTQMLQSIESKVESTVLLLQSFIEEHREAQAVAALARREDRLTTPISVIQTATRKMLEAVQRGTEDIRALADARQVSQGQGALAPISVSEEAAAEAQIVQAYIVNQVDAQHLVLFKGIMGQGTVADPSALQLFLDAMRYTARGGFAYPDLLAPEPHAGAWAQYLGQLSTLLEANNLLLEAARMPTRPGGAIRQPSPILTASLESEVQRVEEMGERLLPRYLPVRSEDMAFLTDPGNRFQLSTTLVLHPTMETRRWRYEEALDFLARNRIGGHTWRLPSVAVLRGLLNKGYTLAATRFGADRAAFTSSIDLMYGLGFDLRVPLLSNGTIIPAQDILTSDGGVYRFDTTGMGTLGSASFGGFLMLYRVVEPEPEAQLVTKPAAVQLVT